MEKNIIAVFGGSFNPPTIAHINLAKQILSNIENIEKVIFVPVSTKYNKNGLAPDEERFDMLKTICKDEEDLDVSSIEMDSDRQLYTIETLQIIKEKNPDKEVCFVLGTDNLKELETWYTSSKLLEQFKIIVVERDNDNVQNIIENDVFLKQHKDSFVILKSIEKIQLSASYIRELIKNKKSIEGLVPKKIQEKVLEIYK